MKGNLKHILELNLATIILGSSGLLGKLINISPPIIIFLRCVIAFLFLVLIKWLLKRNLQLRLKQNPGFFLLSSIFLAAHWVLYFIALEVTTVSVAFISVFTFPIFTTLLEPVFFKTRLSILDLGLSAAVLSGIIILVPEFSLDNSVTVGAFLGIASAVFYALRNLMNKQVINHFSGADIMHHQLLVISLFMWPVLFIFPFHPDGDDLGWLMALAIGTTAIGHSMFVRSLKHFNTSTASIISSLQPVYGIILAIVFLNENPEANVLAGGGLILASALIKNIVEYGGRKTS